MERWKGMFYLCCAFSLAGTSVIAAWLVNEALETFTITAASLFLAIVSLLPLCWGDLVKTVRRLSWREWMLLSLQSLFGVFLFRMFLLYGLLHTSAAEAGILTGATPAATVILAKALLRETIARTKFIGILSTVVGILLIQGLFEPGNPFSLSHMVGNVLVLCAAVSESSFNIVSRTAAVNTELPGRQPIHPIVQTTLVSAMALIFSLIPSSLEHPLASLAAIGWKEWLALVWYGPFVTALAFICWYAGIKRCPASTAAAFSGMMPFTALLLSVIVLGDHAGWQQWAGGFLVILGMILIGKNKTKKPQNYKAESGDHGYRLLKQMK